MTEHLPDTVPFTKEPEDREISKLAGAPPDDLASLELRPKNSPADARAFFTDPNYAVVLAERGESLVQSAQLHAELLRDLLGRHQLVVIICPR